MVLVLALQLTQGLFRPLCRVFIHIGHSDIPWNVGPGLMASGMRGAIPVAPCYRTRITVLNINPVAIDGLDVRTVLEILSAVIGKALRIVWRPWLPVNRPPDNATRIAIHRIQVLSGGAKQRSKAHP